MELDAHARGGWSILGKRTDPQSYGADYRELDEKIKRFVKSGSYDKIGASVAEFVSRRIEQSLTAKKRETK